MIDTEMSIRPEVCDCSGDRLSVQLTNKARKSEKSHCVWLCSPEISTTDRSLILCLVTAS
jgi:hypothetical protein